MNWNEHKFQEWLSLREQLRNAKRNKEWESVVDACSKIIDLDKEAKFIQIFIPIIHKDRGRAFEQLDLKRNAVVEYELSISLLNQVRDSGKIASSDDWLDEIAILEREIQKIKK